ncbi:DUF748 domain-containing protein [Cellvibrio japonicus]|uniref:DUF748 domain-containing protein n=1 Tax=Cellvibrio japonicus (strain Ueda107) TaxID=498211 RepID=B3PDZ0_CELJU|nr:DUF748 domain-containing protein [Cellvibrio japonicus]ACE85752.1 conserved hypothetical protein [Cellvibrio japonicus Ueda107]QEI13474.1 DUF748 domain-containing protein [Cellvibrio japonicus]QEI17048.1 DUF748 domain-containing protein [Cellvibrio japonicus]QEI20626.1 DUF748 domain-containing protein [Cellvibrio japonicus]
MSSSLATLKHWFFLDTALAKALRWLCYLYLGWFLLCCMILTPLLNYAAGKVYREQTGRQLHYDLISLNPFTLNLLIVNASDRNPDQSVFWQFKRADINLAFWQSVFNLAPGLDELSLKGLAVHISQSDKGLFNIDDIVQHRAQLAADAPTPVMADDGDSPLFPFFITQTDLQIDRISYSEHRATTDYRQAINDLRFTLDNFSTVNEEGQGYHLNAHLGDQGTVRISGTVSLASNNSQGNVQVEALPLSPVTDYLQQQLGFHLQSGSIDFNSDYRIHWKNDVHYGFDNGHLTLNQFAILSHNPQDLQLQLEQLSLEKLSLNSEQQQLHIASVALDKPLLKSWSNGPESGLLKALAFTSPTDAGNPGTAENDNNDWDIRIDSLALLEGDITWKLAELDNRDLRLQGLRIDATPLALSGKTDTQFSLSAIALEATPLTIHGTLNPVTLDGQLTLDVQQLPLALANSQLKTLIAGKITQGLFNTQTQINLIQGIPDKILTTGTINQFVLAPSSQQEDALRFDHLGWDNAQVDMTRESLHLPLVTLSGLDGRFIITKEGKTNLDALLITSATRDAQPQATTHTDAEPSWSVALDKLVLDNASFRFNDASLTPQFTAAVQNFGGELTGLSSDTRTRARFLFNGNVDGYAPVSLKGEAQPFLADPMVKAELRFKHLDLGGLSTYSSTYAGWRIERGQLTADLNYHLEQGRILGDNHIEMDKLQLGERVRSARAMDIPIRLALALVTDSNGLAVLDMRVTGDTNDPQFDISKILMSTLKNTLTKIVSAPFRLLAKLVNSEEELEILPFNSGSQAILATANRRLDTLHNALNKRPLLSIDLQGRYDPVSDRRGLQILQANSILSGAGLDSQDIKQKNNRWELAVKQHYRTLPDNHGDKLSADEMFESWIATLPVQDSELQQLALSRANASKQHLVKKFGIDPGRVFINNATQCKEENPAECRRRAVKIELHNTWDLSGTTL